MHDGGIHIFDRGDAGIDSMHRFPPQCQLQAVDQMSRDFLPHVYRVLAVGLVERQRPVDNGRGRLTAAKDLDERDDVRRVDRVPDNVALRPDATVLQFTDQQPRGTRCHDGVGRQPRFKCPVDVRLCRQ